MSRLLTISLLFFWFAAVSFASITETLPVVDEPNAPKNTSIKIVFSEPMDTASVLDNFKLKIQKKPVTTKWLHDTVYYNEGSYTFTFKPADPLAPATYQASMSKKVKNAAGAPALTSDYKWDFTIGDYLAPELTSIALSSTASSVQVGQSVDLSVIGNYSDASTKNLASDVQWVLSDTSLASIDANGVLHANAEGVLSIEAKLDGVSSNVITIDIVNAVEQIALSPSTLSIAYGSSDILQAIGTFSDHSTQDITSQVAYEFSDPSIISIDSSGVITTLKSGTTTVIANLDSIASNSATIAVFPVLQQINLTSSAYIMGIGSNASLTASALYNDGSTENITESVNYVVSDPLVATIPAKGVLTTLSKGTTTIVADLNGVSSDIITIIVAAPNVDTSNFDYTSFGYNYLDTIPANATINQYDKKRFCMIAGKILSEDAQPLQGIQVTIHNHSEYGTAITDLQGNYVIPAEGGVDLTMRYTKNGYTTIDRKIFAAFQRWAVAPDVTMLQVDKKVTFVDLNNSTPQMHISTPVIDERGKRSTTLVFDGVTKATVTAPEGSSKELSSLAVRATEFKTPSSMPANLPPESAYTYCSDLTVDGVSDDENVTFDEPVVMYVENFLGFDVGEIVPVGYYDRNAGEWKASDNGAVVRLLDTDSDGTVDGLDSNGDGLPNDLDGDGSFIDEVAGITDNPSFEVGQTLWRAAFTHFTPWDHNWPYGPENDAEEPEKPKKPQNKPKSDCKEDTESYVTVKSRVFHEDIPVAGTDMTLHYSSKRVDGYTYAIDVPVDTSSAPASALSAIAKLEIAGKVYSQPLALGSNQTAHFEWDGTDASGKKAMGEITAIFTISYRYALVYYSATSAWSQAWAQVGGSMTSIMGRNKMDMSASTSFSFTTEATVTNKDVIANGWTLSNNHKMGTNAIYKGDGDIVEKKISLIDGLVAYYRFEDNGDDSSGHAHHGIAYGGLTYVDGIFGQAASFDGMDDSIIVANHEDFNIKSDFSASVWIKPLENGIYDGVIFAKHYTHGTRSYNVDFRNNTIGMSLFGNDNKWYRKDIDHPDLDNKWINIIFTYHQNEKTVNIYIDGKPDVFKIDTTNIMQTTIPFSIGSYLDSSDGSVRRGFYKGLIDDLRIYNRALSYDEIQALYDYESAAYKFEGYDVSDGSLAYTFDLDGKHLNTKDLYSQSLLQTFGYDGENRLASITDRFNNTATITRDTEGNPTVITAPNGQKTLLIVDVNGDLLEVAYEDSSYYGFSYFAGSLMNQMMDPNGNMISHIFDNLGRIAQESDGAGGVWGFDKVDQNGYTEYITTKPEGETRISKDTVLANGDTQSLITLPSGELVSVLTSKDDERIEINRDGVQTIRTYKLNPLNQQTQLASSVTTQPSGLSKIQNFSMSYDGNETHTFSKTTTVTSNAKTATLFTDYIVGKDTLASPTGRTFVREFNPASFLIMKTTGGSLIPTTYTYDIKGRVKTVTTGDRVITYAYDSRGNVATVTDPKNNDSTYTYDLRDRLTTIDHPNGTTETYEYDDNGNMLKLVTPTPTDHNFAYNGVDLRTNYTSALSHTTTYTYDKNRKLKSVLRPSGDTVINTYLNGRLDTTTTPEGTTSYTYHFADKINTITNGTEKLLYTYDGSLLTKVEQQGVLSQSIIYGFNNDFNVISSTYAGATASYGYDNDGLLTSSDGFTITRDPVNGFATQVSDGVYTQTRTYNNYGELDSSSDAAFGYAVTARDNTGAITQKTETLGGSTVTYGYTYDKRGRLTEVKKGGVVTETYAYDANGNRESATTDAGTFAASYTLDDQLEVYGSNTYAYDLDGFLYEKTTPGGITAYDYGTLGELRSVSLEDGTLIEYLHNASNQRVAKKVNGIITEKYLWKGLTTLLAVYDGSDNLKIRFAYADARMPHKMSYEGATYYLSYDQVGSLRVVSDTAGNVVKEVTYDTFGNILSDSNAAMKMPFGFAGGLYDEDTGLTRFGYRDYDAFTGKWTAKDPIGFNGGDTNLYGYVLGDPVNLMDPSGLTGIEPYFPGDITQNEIDAWNNSRKNSGVSYPYRGPFGPICGSGPSARWLVPDFFPESCQQHDDCYSTCGKTKLECDLELTDPYGSALRNWPLSIPSQEAYDNAQEHCECK